VHFGGIQGIFFFQLFRDQLLFDGKLLLQTAVFKLDLVLLGKDLFKIFFSLVGKPPQVFYPDIQLVDGIGRKDRFKVIDLSVFVYDVTYRA